MFPSHLNYCFTYTISGDTSGKLLFAFRTFLCNFCLLLQSCKSELFQSFAKISATRAHDYIYRIRGNLALQMLPHKIGSQTEAKVKLLG
jgi:hypothetical protein